MSLTPQQLARLTQVASASLKLESVATNGVDLESKVSIHTVYVYYYLTTFSEEVNIMWPQKWRIGKVLFLFIRYAPMFFMVTILLNMRVYADLSPKTCTNLWLAFRTTLDFTSIIASEVALLICLFALLNARRPYVLLLVAIYTGMTLGASIPSLRYDERVAQTLPLTDLEHDLGYACTWAGVSDPNLRLANKKAGYVSLAKAVALSAFALYIFLVRYRNQTGTLFQTMRRDSGVYILAFVALRLGAALALTLRTENDLNLPGYVFSMCVLEIQNTDKVSSPVRIFQVAVPMLACRLLLEIRKSADTSVRTAISTILFNPPWTGDETKENFDDDAHERPQEMVRFQGLGRRRAADGGEVNQDAEVGTDTNATVVEERRV
ncbi:hypothetical protein DFP72DRAFT_1054612 [Ephemerocybe angulata]|uniref:DUF6533 domain-containing protein n=1 Tax=Ephemerocybe angulata TaxID=980116 RepID=A0A8H6H7L0_9AGAR|nr:hypothetical protein DFP72DRAFT_1054612 [Tulosesus angulatus]